MFSHVHDPETRGRPLSCWHLHTKHEPAFLWLWACSNCSMSDWLSELQTGSCQTERHPAPWIPSRTSVRLRWRQQLSIVCQYKLFNTAKVCCQCKCAAAVLRTTTCAGHPLRTHFFMLFCGQSEMSVCISLSVKISVYLLAERQSNLHVTAEKMSSQRWKQRAYFRGMNTSDRVKGGDRQRRRVKGSLLIPFVAGPSGII